MEFVTDVPDPKFAVNRKVRIANTPFYTTEWHEHIGRISRVETNVVSHVFDQGDGLMTLVPEVVWFYHLTLEDGRTIRLREELLNEI